MHDVVFVGDFRFPGGTSASVAEEIVAQAAAGYRTGLIQIKAPVLRFPHPFHPAIRVCIDRGLADLLDPDRPVSAGLAVVQHPQIFTHRPLRPLRISADVRLIAGRHPPFNGEGKPFYDWRSIDANTAEAVGGEVAWAPVGPVVRRQFERLDDGPRLHDADWPGFIDPDAWHFPRNGVNGRLVIGRHSRPDPLKWPDDRETTLAAYPADPRFAVRVLGAGSFLPELVGPYPPNWDVTEFQPGGSQDFLRGVDFWVYYHSSKWVEAFGRTIIEAMASGAVVVLPPHFQPLFRNAALYCGPREAPEVVRSYHEDQDACLEQRETALAAVRKRFSPAAHLARLRDLVGSPRAQPPKRAPRRPVPPARVLFVSSNGVGMGHLTRLLAIARRLPPSVQPVFVTMSQAMRVVHDFGFLAEYLPFHAYLGADQDVWNAALADALGEMIEFYDPRVVVFDGNVPYSGLVGALESFPGVAGIWSRRAMWRPDGPNSHILKREAAFDAVLEPGEIAAAFDRGPTTMQRGRTRTVAPIRLLHAEEALARDAARRDLGLDLERPALLLALGSGNNYSIDAIRRRALAYLAERGDVQVAVAEWLMAERTPDLPDDVLRLRRYPLARYFAAFDAAVSAVGYNSFHELLFAGVPTVWVPNEHPQQDAQLTRARYAEQHGLGLCLRTPDVYRLRRALDQILDPAEQEAIRARCATLDATNGAVEAARLIEEFTYTRRADRVSVRA